MLGRRGSHEEMYKDQMKFLMSVCSHVKDQFLRPVGISEISLCRVATHLPLVQVQLFTDDWSVCALLNALEVKAFGQGWRRGSVVVALGLGSSIV